MDQLFLLIKAFLQAQVPELEYIQMYNNHFDLENEGNIYALPGKWCLVEFDDDQPYNQLGAGYQIIDPLFIKLHITDVVYNNLDGTQEQNLDIFVLKQKIFAAIQKFEPAGAVAFMRVSETQDKSHKARYHYIQTYQTNYIDQARSEPIGGVDSVPPTDVNLTVTYSPPPYLKGI